MAATQAQIIEHIERICAAAPRGWQTVATRCQKDIGVTWPEAKDAVWAGHKAGRLAVSLVARSDSPLVHGGSLAAARIGVLRQPAPVRAIAAPPMRPYVPDAAMRQQIARCRSERGGVFRPQGLGGAMTVHEPAAVLDGRTAP